MSSRKHRGHRRTMAAFLLVVLSLALYLWRHPSHPQTSQPLTKMSELRDRYQQDGIDGFWEAKASLRAQVTTALTNEETEEEASRIAVYLFPDLLPDSNFEKPLAHELWGHLEDEIEREPRSPQSRLSFEELRANIWNYESPNQIGELSEHAEQMLAIYDAISTP